MENLIIPFSFCSESEMADDSQKEEQAFSDYPIGPGRQFSHVEEMHSHSEELGLISEQKFIVSESKVTELFKGKCKDLAVLVNVQSNPKVLAAPWSCVGTAEMATKASGSHQTSMEKCIPTISNSHLPSCSLEITCQD